MSQTHIRNSMTPVVPTKRVTMLISVKMVTDYKTNNMEKLIV